MSFTVRNANVNDAAIIYEMITLYQEEVNIRNSKFTNSLESFINDCFGNDSIVHFFIAEFQENILGYCGYTHSYNITSGPSINILEVFVKKEYRNIGVSVFLFSKVIDVAFANNSFLIKWAISLKDEKLVAVEEKAGVFINKDILILNISNENLKKHLTIFNKKQAFEVRLVKSYELPDVFECVKNLAIETKTDLKQDVYKLMSAAFSTKPKINVMVVLIDNEVFGFMSFYEAYCTCSGKSLIVDQVYVDKKHRAKGIGTSLLNGLFKHAYDNDYSKVESSISKFEVEKIEALKEVGVFPYENIRVAWYVKEDYKKLYND